VGAMNTIDYAIITSAGTGLFFFLFTHILALRYLKRFSAPILIITSILAGFLCGVFVFILFNQIMVKDSVVIFGFSAILSSVIYLFFVFHYIAWFFGMGEASVRIRLLFELDRSATQEGASLEEIMKNYNAEKILETRLARLVTAGHASFDGTFYRMKSPILLVQLMLIRFFC